MGTFGSVACTKVDVVVFLAVVVVAVAVVAVDCVCGPNETVTKYTFIIAYI